MERSVNILGTTAADELGFQNPRVAAARNSGLTHALISREKYSNGLSCSNHLQSLAHGINSAKLAQ
jgi:hypothetical protein